MKIKDFLALFEQSAARRCQDAHRAMAQWVVSHMNRYVGDDYFARLERHQALVDREKRRHEFWMRLRLLDAGLPAN